MEATYRHNADYMDYTPASAIDAGQVIQLPDGRAGIAATDIASGALGAVAVRGVHRVTKTSGVVLLAGGKVYWDHSANSATFRSVNDRDFFLGTVTADAASADTVCYVNLNVEPSYTLDLANGFRTLMILTSGTPRLFPCGKGLQATFSATAEAQKIDALSYDGVAVSANAIVEGRITIVDGGDNAALDINVGVANATHATDADSIAESCFIHIDGTSTNINAESDDGTTEVAATDTTLDYTLGTAFEFWMDLRDPSDIQIYINGALVLSATTFTLAAATGPLKLLFHMEKTSDDTTANVAVDWLRARIME